jgi:hypothetical protein
MLYPAELRGHTGRLYSLQSAVGNPRANPDKVEDFGGARDQEKWIPVFRQITRQFKISITFITSDRFDLK